MRSDWPMFLVVLVRDWSKRRQTIFWSAIFLYTCPFGLFIFNEKNLVILCPDPDSPNAVDAIPVVAVAVGGPQHQGGQVHQHCHQHLGIQVKYL